MAARDLFPFLLLFLSSFGAGRKISRHCFSSYHWLDDALSSFGLGFGLLSYVLLALGFSGLLYSSVIFGVLILFFLISLPEWKDFLRALDAHITREKILSLNSVERFLLALFIVTAFVCFLICFAPSLVWDELHYHLPVPALYLKAHRIHWLPYLPYSNFPQLMEMLFLCVLALGTGASANFVHGFFALLTVLAVYRMASFFFSRQAGIFALTVFLFVPVALALVPTSYVDFGFSFYGLLSFYFLVRGVAQRDRPMLLLSSVFLGFSFCTKYSALFFYGIALIFLVREMVRVKQNFFSPGFFLLYAALPGFFLLPYLLKNVFLTGNPVYPFLFSVFGGKGLTASESTNIVQSIVGFGGVGKTAGDLLFLPWRITLYGQYFFGSPGPIFLACVPAFALSALSPSCARVRPFLFFGLVYLIFWFHGTQQMRFLLPSLAALSVAVGYLYDTWSRAQRKFFVFALPFLLGHCALGMAGFSHFKDIPLRLRAGAGFVSREEYLSHALESYDAYQYVNAHLTQHDRVYLVNDNRGFYCNIPAIPSSGAFMLNYNTNLPDEKRYRLLKEHGVTHIIVNGSLCVFDKTLCEKVSKDFGRGYVQQVFQKNGVFVLKVLYEKIFKP